MADKPKTYAQQVQELKQQLEDALTDKNEAERQASFIPELQEEIAELKSVIAAWEEQSRVSGVNIKAQNTDLLQRAEQAELALRNRANLLKDYQAEKEGLLQQIDILENERLKHKGKDEKILMLHEELQKSNLRVAAAQQQVKDQQVATNEAIAQMEKEVIYLRQLAKAQKDLITALTREIEAIPYDGLQALRNLAKNG